VKTTLYTLFLAVISFVAKRRCRSKVKVGYDKGTIFPDRNPTHGPNLHARTRGLFSYEAVVARVDVELQSRGLTKLPNHGDLTLTPSGGVDVWFAGKAATPYSPTYGGPPPTTNATMWTGARGQSTVGFYVPEGLLVLTFVDRNSNKTVWSGSGKQTARS
jgi:hypothetical protein